jgi:hypothetical protein
MSPPLEFICHQPVVVEDRSDVNRADAIDAGGFYTRAG